MSTDQYSYSLDLTPDDYRRFYASVARQQGQDSTWVYLIAAGCVVPVGVFFGYVTPFRALGIGMSCGIAFLLGLYAMWQAVYVVQLRTVTRLAATGVVRGSRFSIKLDDDGVVANGDGINTLLRWSVVTDVTVEDGSLMIWLDRLQAVRIPARAFAGSAERDALLAFARSRMTAPLIAANGVLG